MEKKDFKKGESGNLQLENRRLSAELKKVQGDLDRLKRENKRLKESFKKTAAKYEELEKTYVEIINSFAWRMTAWFRKGGAFLRRFKPIDYALKAVSLLFAAGPKALMVRVGGKLQIKKLARSYRSRTNRSKEKKTVFPKDIKISILVPLYNTPIKFLKEMIKSVENQTYQNWELCLADGSDGEHAYVGEYVEKLREKDSRIVYKKLPKNLGISGNTNACIDISSGEYIALFDHDDLLHGSALYNVMKAICEKDADFIYTDEATFTGKRPSNIVLVHYKEDYAPDTLRSYNYICHLSVFSRALLDEVGPFRSECDGSQDYDLILRLTEKAKNIVHIPKALYFWRGHENSTAQDISSKPYIISAAHRALSEHLERQGLKGTVKDSAVPSTYKIDYEIKDEPLVSVIIANKDEVGSLDTCLQSIYDKTTYKNFEVIIVENNSTEEETFEYYEQIEDEYENLKVIYWKDKFNYSAINNFGFKEAKGEYVLLLNNDVEIITPNWIEEMLMFAQRSDVGAVGAMLYYPDNTIQHAGVILGIGGVAGHSHKNYKRGEFGYMSRAAIAQNLTAVTFACVMMPSSVYKEVGGLDEAFEVAFNDVDMCMRIRKAGYLVVFTPYAELYHYESKSRGTENTPAKVRRFNSEVERFKARWGKELEAGDPYYNRNLTLEGEDFSYRS